MLMHDGLLTNSKKKRFGIGSAMCSFCRYVKEDTLHVLRDFSRAMALWMTAVHANMRFIFFAGDLKKWIYSNMQNNMGWYDNQHWKVFRANACHKLWNWHSKESHEDNYSRPSNMVSHINKIVQDYKQAEIATCTNMDHCKELKLIKWETLVMRRVKLNIDGARDKQGNA